MSKLTQIAWDSLDMVEKYNYALNRLTEIEQLQSDLVETKVCYRILQAELDASPWRDVSKGELPKEMGKPGIFIVIVNGGYQLATYAYSDQTWANLKGLVVYPTHWMAIPGQEASDETN